MAGVVEHLALLDGTKPPEWTQRPSRFSPTPITVAGSGNIAPLNERLALSPACFLRHGTPIDVYDLDARGGGAEFSNATAETVSEDTTNALLQELDEKLKEQEERGHLYAAPNGDLIVATTKNNRRKGQQPRWEDSEALLELLDRIGARDRWQTLLTQRNDTTPAPAVWSTANLVVTGISQTHAHWVEARSKQRRWHDQTDSQNGR